MATFYLVRHGQPDYSGLQERGMFGFGRDFAPLSPLGVQQAEEAARDPRLSQAELIVSSPYTRALQTAQIISQRTGISVKVEPELHEWVPDWTNQYRTSEEAFRLSEDFVRCQGVYPAGECRKWESLAHMQERMQRVAERYATMDKVILIGHGMAFRTICYIEQMKPGEIVECQYEPGQSVCEYSFY